MHPGGVDNPYRPPASATLAAERPGRRIGWKLYTGFVALMHVSLFLGYGLHWIQGADIVDLVISAVGLAGLFGYAFRRRLASAAFWKGWLPFQIAWDLVAQLVLLPLGWIYRLSAGAEPSTLDEVLTLAILLPLYLGVFRYAFRSPEIWER